MFDITFTSPRYHAQNYELEDDFLFRIYVYLYVDVRLEVFVFNYYYERFWNV